MVDCPRFLENYSDFRDGQLEEAVRQQFQAHLAACASCARYDLVISEGVRLYGRCGTVEPSDDFLPRLQHRLYHLQDEMRGPGGRSGSGVHATLALSAAAMIAIAAWIPALRPQPVLVELPAVAARAPLTPPEAAPRYRGDPFFTSAVPEFGRWTADLDARSANDLLFRYSPLGSDLRVQPVSQR